MEKLTYEVRFVTPAFLGSADQVAQWRTPPFKALLRQWWRVAQAKRFSYDHQRMREEEGALFGHAWLKRRVNEREETWASKSIIQIRITPWSPGRLTTQTWPGATMASVTTTQDGRGHVRADVYLGFGPVQPPSRRENRPSVTLRGDAIGTEDKAMFSLFPADTARSMNDTLQLIAWFGTMGSRCRNGWGSLRLASDGTAPALTSLPLANDELLLRICRQWTDCLALEWPHALGAVASKPLVWITEPFRDWRNAMECLAAVRVGVRRAVKRFTGPGGIGGIHLLGYPAGEKWKLPALGTEARLASQLRFKVVETNTGIVGVVSHFPCRVPDVLANKLDTGQRDWLHKNQKAVWEAIHDNLNNSTRVSPLPGGARK